ncbi:MAG: SHOCT domain-containing protein [Clostridiaceae bacterium]|nr:SHOCT domain-containing protein [Clostridiaceae bacterium]
MRQYRFRPSGEARTASRLFMIPFTLIAAGFIVLGITVVIPSGAGFFGYLWTGMSAVFLCFGLYGLLSKKGLPWGWDMEVEERRSEEEPPFEEEGIPPATSAEPGTNTARMEELHAMYVKGLITRDEYDIKRREILNRM